MQLNQASWPEVEAYLKKSRGIVIPIGSTEQHGPNGLLGTDAICPEVIAKAAGDEAGFLVGPTFNVGSAQHHLGFTGTITLRPTTMIAALNDWIDSLHRHGFKRILFFNGHGGNITTLDAAFVESYAAWSLDGEACPYKLKQTSWWMFQEVADVCKELFPEGDGSHATASEVAVTYYAYPEAVKKVDMSPRIAPEGRFTDAADYRKNFPDGRIGSDPSQATPEKGKRIVEVAAKALIREAEAFFAS